MLLYHISSVLLTCIHALCYYTIFYTQCTAQAFFGQAVVATVTYNTILAIQYLMIIKLNIPETTIAKKYEKIMHTIPILMWLVTGAIGIGFEVFNPAFFNCWIAPVPINCAAYGEIPDGRPPCTRGFYAPLFQWLIFYGLIWSMIVIVTVIMMVVYCSVRKTEQKIQKYASASTDRTSQMKHSKKVAKQGLWYLLPFYATWVFPVATEITEMVTAKYYDPMVVLVSFFLPFQGALNFIIYMRPRYLKYRNKHPEWSIWHIIWRTVKKSFCCVKGDDEDNFKTEAQTSQGFLSKLSSAVGGRSSTVDDEGRRSSIDIAEDNVKDGIEEEKVEEQYEKTNNERRVSFVEDGGEAKFSYRDMWPKEDTDNALESGVIKRNFLKQQLQEIVS